MQLKDSQLKATRDGFGDGIVEAGKINKQLVVLTGDLTDSVKAEEFKATYPEKFIQIGIAEQNMAGIAGGLAASGKVPFMCSFGAFSPGINWGQIRLSICYSQRNVKVIGTHVGISAAADGVSQQTLEDLALTRVLPHMTVVNPIDYFQAKKATIAAANHKGPMYLRFGREKTPLITKETDTFSLNKTYKLKEGKDITIFTTGTITSDVILAQHILKTKHNIEAQVIAVPTVKPLNKKNILEYAKKSKKIVTVEEHNVIGGFGSGIAELLGQNYPTHMCIIGVEDTFAESGTYEQLKEKYGISTNQIVIKILKFLGAKA